MSELDELKLLSKALMLAMEQKQFFLEGYARGSASISEVKAAQAEEYKAYSKLWDFLKANK